MAVTDEQEERLIVPDLVGGWFSLCVGDCCRDRLEVCFAAVSCFGHLIPGGLAFAVPTREVREGRSCRYILYVHNFVVGTFVQIRISADRACSKAAAAAGFEFLLHTCSPSKMEVHNFASIVSGSTNDFVAGTRDGVELLNQSDSHRS